MSRYMKKYISVTYLKIVIGTIILMIISFLCGVFSKVEAAGLVDNRLTAAKEEAALNTSYFT